MVTSSQELLLHRITQTYETNKHFKELLDNIINNKNSVSLRLIDWFITHYCKNNNLIFWIDTTNNNIYLDYSKKNGSSLKKFHIYLEYRAQLKSYTKTYFDPFRRHERISFILEKKPLKVIETTIGQLNFFRWFFQNNILQYIIENKDTLEDEMLKYQNNKKKKGGDIDKTEIKNISKKKNTPVVTDNSIIKKKYSLSFD